MSGAFTLYIIYMRRIAIQGEIGSYHDVASHCYVENEDIELICCDTWVMGCVKLLFKVRKATTVPKVIDNG